MTTQPAAHSTPAAQRYETTLRAKFNTRTHSSETPKLVVRSHNNKQLSLCLEQVGHSDVKLLVMHKSQHKQFHGIVKQLRSALDEMSKPVAYNSAHADFDSDWPASPFVPFQPTSSNVQPQIVSIDGLLVPAGTTITATVNEFELPGATPKQDKYTAVTERILGEKASTAAMLQRSRENAIRLGNTNATVKSRVGYQI